MFEQVVMMQTEISFFSLFGLKVKRGHLTRQEKQNLRRATGIQNENCG